MKIQVLGPGCANCKRLHANTLNALAELSLPADLEKVEDYREIMKYGVMSTPALVVDGVVRSFGRVLSVEEIKTLVTS